MKKEIETKSAIFPMPVLMVATYNDDGTVDVMNAAWGMMLEMDQIVLNLSDFHKTTKNILKRKAFTVSVADAKHVKEADYFGIASGNDTPNKLEKSKMTFSKSNHVDAPIINEFPVCMECEFLEETSCGIVGRVLNVTADEKVLTDGNVDISKLDAIAYDPFTNGYYVVKERVGNAFKDGLSIKK